MRPSTLYMTNAHLELYTFMVSAASVDTSTILPVVLHIRFLFFRSIMPSLQPNKNNASAANRNSRTTLHIVSLLMVSAGISQLLFRKYANGHDHGYEENTHAGNTKNDGYKCT